MDINPCYEAGAQYEYLSSTGKKQTDLSTISQYEARQNPQISNKTTVCSKKAAVLAIVILALAAGVVGMGTLAVLSYIEIKDLQTQNQGIHEMMQESST